MSSLVNNFAFLFKLVLKITNKPVVLCYHRITKQKFDAQVSFLKKLGVIKPFKKLVNDSIKAKPSFSIALTMDDCYSQEFNNAYDVCQKQQVHCTYFLPTSYSANHKSLWSLRLINFLNQLSLPATIKGLDGKEVTFNTEQDKHQYELHWVKEFLNNDTQTKEIEGQFDTFFEVNKSQDTADVVMSKEQLQSITSNQYTSLQSHTVTHPKLFLQSTSERNNEFETSKKYLQDITTEEQHTVCYPYGSAKLIGDSYKQAKEYYTYGVTLQAGCVKKDTNPMLIPRIGIYEHDTSFRILLKILNSQFK